MERLKKGSICKFGQYEVLGVVVDYNDRTTLTGEYVVIDETGDLISYDYSVVYKQARGVPEKTREYLTKVYKLYCKKRTLELELSIVNADINAVRHCLKIM